MFAYTVHTVQYILKHPSRDVDPFHLFTLSGVLTNKLEQFRIIFRLDKDNQKIKVIVGWSNTYGTVHCMLYAVQKVRQLDLRQLVVTQQDCFIDSKGKRQSNISLESKPVRPSIVG